MHEDFSFTVFIGDVAANSDGIKKILHKFEREAVIDYVYESSNTAVTKADTNYNTFNVKNATDATTLASVANGPNSSAGTSLTAGVPTVFSTMTGGVVHAGDVLTFEPTKTGNGLIQYGMAITVVGRYTN